MANASFCPLCGEMLPPDEYYDDHGRLPDGWPICSCIAPAPPAPEAITALANGDDAPSSPPTIEERVASLERQIAGLAQSSLLTARLLADALDAALARGVAADDENDEMPNDPNHPHAWGRPITLSSEQTAEFRAMARRGAAADAGDGE